MIIFLAEIAFGVLIYFQEAPYPNVIRDSVEATVTKKYHNNSTATTQTFDLIQEGVSLTVYMYLERVARKLQGVADGRVDIGFGHSSNCPILLRQQVVFPNGMWG